MGRGKAIYPSPSKDLVLFTVT